MTAGIWLLVGVLVLAALAYLRLSLRLAAAIIVLLMIVATAFFHAPLLLLIAGWLVGLVLVALIITSLRRTLISDRILPLLRRALPAMSQTEREALEAGTV